MPFGGCFRGYDFGFCVYLFLWVYDFENIACCGFGHGASHMVSACYLEGLFGFFALAGDWVCVGA